MVTLDNDPLDYEINDSYAKPTYKLPKWIERGKDTLIPIP